MKLVLGDEIGKPVKRLKRKESTINLTGKYEFS